MQTALDYQKVFETLPDRRRRLRYRFSIPITIRSTDGRAIPGISMEISESGMSAITAESLEVADTVELEPIAGGRVLAVVRRNIGRVYGFEFLDLTAEQIKRINDSCKLLARYEGKTLGI
jgi:hypothetical protein